MAFYEDLTPYNYHHYCERELNIGWLQKGQPFSIGDTSEEFLEKLKLFNEEPLPIFKTRGSHVCEFCDEKYESSHEIRIVGPGSSSSQDITDNIVYACPELIIHYVEKHNYLPPQEFIDAVMNCMENHVGPAQDKYTTVVYKILPSLWSQRKPDMNDENYEENMRKIMVENLSKEIDQQIMNDIMKESSDFQKFVESYNKVMPAVYLINKKN